jgi:hypothetical protein
MVGVVHDKKASAERVHCSVGSSREAISLMGELKLTASQTRMVGIALNGAAERDGGAGGASNGSYPAERPLGGGRRASPKSCFHYSVN